MFRIRQVQDTILPVNQQALRQVEGIFAAQFPDVKPEEWRRLVRSLSNPFAMGFRTLLAVAENGKRLQGAAVLLHDPDRRFGILEYMASRPRASGGGIGGALYQWVREECIALGVEGLFYECLPDDPTLCRKADMLSSNRARLRFYEHYGARPIANTRYETPVNPQDDCPPYLVYDGLEPTRQLRRDFARQVVRLFLERKYKSLCPPDYVATVVESFQDDPVKLRPFRYVKPSPGTIAKAGKTSKVRSDHQLALVVSDQHDLHHVRERGYVEAPPRIEVIVRALEEAGLCRSVPIRKYADSHLTKVHARAMVDYVRSVCSSAPEGKSIYPYVFPIRNRARFPHDPSIAAGYYCIDTFTPLNANAYVAARRAVDVALTAADEILRGARTAYALVRPPGHHAERNAFGGFCYFNNAAIAAQHLAAHGRVAILDIDYHFGNGQANIFYERDDVLTVSIHGHPRFAYPYFSGFEDEHGEGRGEGANVNLPLDESVDGPRYAKALEKALQAIDAYSPAFLVVPLGLDTARGDPTGTWALMPADFARNGRMLGELGLPTVVVQEGGYRTRGLGVCARRFFEGLLERPAQLRRSPNATSAGVVVVEGFSAAHREPLRELLAATTMFTPNEVEIAQELVDEFLARGEASGYSFFSAIERGHLVGYACYGPIPCTEGGYDLYWIAVAPEHQGSGIGRLLVDRVLDRVRALGGRRLYLDTSSREAYAPTRAFYTRIGFRVAATLDDFYRPGDGKVVFVKDCAPTVS